jgi:VanZ family protein
VSEVVPRALAPLALMAAIFLASAQSDPGPDLAPALRVIGHALEYALLATLWAWALAPVLRSPWAVAAGISFVYACLDEYHQSFIPGRDADPLDIVADSVGIALGVVALRVVVVRSRTG